DAVLIGGIAVGAIIFDILLTTFNFLRASTTGLAAQALGAGDEVEQKAVFLRAGLIAVVSGIVIVVLQVPILWVSLKLMGAEPAVAAVVGDYFTIRVLASPFALVNYAVLGWFVGMGRTRFGAGLQILLSLVNIALSLLLVLRLGWGVAGVAWGSVLAEIITAAVGLVLIARFGGGRPFPALSVVLDRARLRRLVGINRDIMIRSFSLLFAFAFFTAQGARAGAVVLAANALLMNFFIFGGYFLDGFATAAEQITGRAVGARFRPAFDAAVRLTLVWGFALAGALSVILLIAGPTIIDLMTTSVETRLAARTYLVWAALTPVLGVVAFQMDGIFIGSTWSADMRNMMLASLAIYLVVWWLAVPVFGNHGLWLALLVFLSARGITLSWRCYVRAGETFGTG
ncbi:MAG: MATE family efflux transporter, partial [Hyphomicrobiales bacterium]|nr:MATE family efflux transporter [Hyphomicrobiales bacterium]